MFPRPERKKVILSIVGSAILAFGLYQVHAQADVTEGGILGLSLLLDHWFRISPAVTNFVLNIVCYLIGWRTLGKEFLLYSAISGGGFSVFYGIFERFPVLYPDIAQHPLAAALIGAAFVGVGIGLAVRAGGAPGGDDALAMSVIHRLGCRIQTVYLISDLTVLVLSLTYIPLQRILYSLLTVVLSGQIIGWIQLLGEKKSVGTAASNKTV